MSSLFDDYQPGSFFDEMFSAPDAARDHYSGIMGSIGTLTPAEYAATVGDREPSLAEPVGQMTELFHDARYDGIPVTRDQAEKARSVWRRIATSVKRVEPTAE